MIPVILRSALARVSKDDGHRPGRSSFETAALRPPQDDGDRAKSGLKVWGHYPVGVPWRHWPPAIFAAAITAWVRLSTPSFCRIAETCALMVASDTPSS